MGNVRWRGYDHPAMYDMIKSGPGAPTSDPITAYWEGLSKELGDINTTLNDGLGKLKVAWEGDAAQSAQGGLNPLQQWSTDAQTGATIMKISSEDQATFNSSARSNMPEPVKVTTPEPSTWDKIKAGGAAALGINGPANQVAQQSADHEAQEAAQQAAAQKAVQTMETYQSSSEWNSSTLGTFVPSPDVVVSVNPESGQHVTQVQSHNVATPNGGSDTSGTTHASGFVQPNGPTSGIPSNPTHAQPHTPFQGTPPVNTPVQGTPTTVQTTSPNWAQPPSTNNPTNPVRPPGPGTNQPFPTDTNPSNGNPNNPGNPNGPGGRGPITGPVNGEPGNPVRGTTPPNGRGTLGPNGNGANRTGMPRTGGLPGGPGEQVRNPNSRLRPGVGPNALEEGGRGGGRPGIGARSASAYSYGEGANGARGGVTSEPGGANGRGGTGGVNGRGGAGGVNGRGGAGGTGGAGRGGAGGAGGAGRGAGAGDGSRGGNRFIRNANAAVEAEERLGGRGGNAGANGSKGAGGRMGRGQRGEDEEDYEYQHADYLVDTEDVFLDDRLVAPPVIGDKSANA
jgi:hypothetical protein